MKREFPDETLSAYLDGELAADERAEFEAQAAANPAIRQMLDELQALSSRVRELPQQTAGQDFADRVVRAALAAKAQQNGAVSLPTASSSDGRSDRRAPGRRAFYTAALAGVAATAAAVALMVWSWGGSRPGGPGVNPGVNIVTTEPILPAELTSAEKALARLRLALPQEGEAMVVRIRLGPGGTGNQELDAALSAAGIGTRSDAVTAAMNYGKAYRDKLVEKFGGQQPGAINQAYNDGTIAPADAVFVEASLEAVEKALSQLANKPESAFEVCPVMRIAAAAAGVGPDEVAAGESASQSIAGAPKFYAQRLNAALFRLEKAFQTPADDAAPVAAAVDATKPIRMLILVERAE